MKNGKNLSTASEHRRHDRLLVTRFAMDDAYPSELDEAKSLVESCIECAALASDIRLISGAMTTVPSLSRPRDFSITQEQAERLRGSALSRLLRRLGASAPLWGTVRPVAAAALSIGLVAAVVGVSLPNQAAVFDTAATGGGLLQENAAASSEPVSAPELTPNHGDPGNELPPSVDLPGGIEAQPDGTAMPMTQRFDQAYSVESDDGSGNAPGSSAEEMGAEPDSVSASASGPKDLLIYAGLAVALLSAALLAVAWIARRHFADPLLR